MAVLVMLLVVFLLEINNGLTMFFMRSSLDFSYALTAQETHDISITYPFTLVGTDMQTKTWTTSGNVNVTCSTSNRTASGCSINGKNTKTSGNTNWTAWFLLVIAY